eukprot:scaffold321751_cov31-Tisochrysis_lutea.AAC.4
MAMARDRWQLMDHNTLYYGDKTSRQWLSVDLDPMGRMGHHHIHPEQRGSSWACTPGSPPAQFNKSLVNNTVGAQLNCVLQPQSPRSSR